MNMTTKKTTGKKKDSIDSKKIIKELKKELKEKNEKLLRSIADFQNYQKRMDKELQIKEVETKKKYRSLTAGCAGAGRLGC